MNVPDVLSKFQNKDWEGLEFMEGCDTNKDEDVIYWYDRNPPP